MSRTTIWAPAAQRHRTPVEDSSQVAVARELAATTAAAVGCSDAEVDAIALAATELAENLHRHAVHGELIVECEPDGQLTLLAVDRGPGVARFDLCLSDGYSTAGTLGTGLGAVVRRARHFDAASEVGFGTVVRAVFGPSAPDPDRTGFDVGAMGFPLRSHEPNGDTFAAFRDSARLTVIVADGLGHGPDAASASSDATGGLATTAHLGPAAVLAAADQPSSGGRGSAATVASVRHSDLHDGGEVISAGLGDVALLVVGADGSTQRVAVDRGTVGARPAARPVERQVTTPPRAILMLHTDGLSNTWTLNGRAALLRHDAKVIATALWRDHARDTDDNLIVVVKARPWPAP